VRHNDPEVVAREYATEKGLLGRRAAYQWAEGPDPRELTFQAVAEAAPVRVLEVGPGPGELSQRIRDELGADVVAVDISPRMVELARARGIHAIVGDVQELPFEDESFDCAVAAWMLYHVPDVELGVRELARVLRPGDVSSPSRTATTTGTVCARSSRTSAASSVSRPKTQRSCSGAPSRGSTGATRPAGSSFPTVRRRRHSSRRR
jgi:SAM-dependent methyltransferase